MANSWTLNGLVVGLLLVAALIRVTDIGHAVDGHLREPYHEIESAGVARALHSGEASLLAPRTEWNATLTGWLKPLPAQEGLAATAYRLFGENDRWLRWISYLAAILGVWVFWLLARELLPSAAAEVALLFFVFSPLAVRTASLAHPSALALLLYLVAILAVARWRNRDEKVWFGVALAATPLAVLVDVAALHVLLIQAGLVVTRDGWRALCGRKHLLLGISALGVALAWYGAQWTSVGAGANPPAVPAGVAWGAVVPSFEALWRIVLLELAFVWMPAGVIFAWWGSRWWLSPGQFGYFGWWLLALLISYLAFAPWTATFGALSWHVYSLPLAAMCVGLGFAAAMGSLPAALGATTNPAKRRLAVILFGITLANQLALTYLDANTARWSSHYLDAQSFRPHVPSSARVAVVGEARKDALGAVNRGDAAYYLYWMRRRGQTLAPDALRLDGLVALRADDYGFLIAERRWLARQPQLDDALRLRFRVVKEGRRAVLFGLR